VLANSHEAPLVPELSGTQLIGRPVGLDSGYVSHTSHSFERRRLRPEKTINHRACLFSRQLQFADAAGLTPSQRRDPDLLSL
jgi:hypothetical protein